MIVYRPMLCAKLKDPVSLTYPVLLTPKFDGIRCLKLGGQLLSRAFKPIRNRHIVETLATLPDGLDGELMVRDAEFGDVQSGIMSYDGKPDFVFNVFDWCGEAGYTDRLEWLKTLPSLPHLATILPFEATDVSQFLAYEEQCLAEGYEGVISRSPTGPYKCGRATLREGYMAKFKRVADSEARILGLVEANENTNPIVYNAFGKAKRPGGSEGKVPKNTLGSMQVCDIHTNVFFEIGTGKGLTAALRQHMWDNQAEYIGRIVRYNYQAVGVKDRPRFPSFQGFRDADDIS